jgi:carbon-monoxide dehydrogenase large subunit
MSGPGVAAGRFIGKSVLRKEDPRLLSGRGRYVDDIRVPRMLHAAFLRSHVARGTITHLDVTAAARAEGVVAVYTAADLNGRMGPMEPTMFIGGALGPNAPLRALADGDVRFVGEPIALVVATSRYLAEDACELIEVDIDPLPPIVDPELALTSSELVHPDRPGNIAAAAEVPNPAVDAALASAAHVVQAVFHQSRQSQAPMETRGVLAEPGPMGESLTVWMAGQMPHEARSILSRAVGLPEHAIRVIQHDVGGGFGQKSFANREEIVVARAALLAGKPVKWIEDRRENLMAATHARWDRLDVTMALDDDGHILATKLDHLEDSGAFPWGGSGGGGFLVGALLTGPYRIPASAFKTAAAYTNTCARGAYRGPWMAESVAREQMVDVAARSIGMDPLELRRRNVLRAEDLPYSTPLGMVFDDITPAECLEQAAQIIDYDGFRAQQAEALREGRLLGLGIGLYIEPTAGRYGALGIEAAHVRVEPSGSVSVSLGTGSHGQGLETTMAQVVADSLGVDVDLVRVNQGDTDVAPFGGGTGGSRSAVIAGGAARAASVKVKDQAIAIAAHMLEAAPDDVVLEDGQLFVQGTPARSVSLADVALASYTNPDGLPPGVEPGLEAVARYTPPPFTWGNSCHICTCEVDRETGLVKLLRYVVSEDCGVMINPMVVEGQVAGGVVQGIGGVLFEYLVYDDDGNPLSTTFLDYTLPTATDVPTIEYGHMETPAPNPGGHKGVGEGGAIGSVPAVFNAVADALAQVGATVRAMPLNPNTVLEALDAAVPSR